MELFIEDPVGHRTTDSQFLPGEQVRIAGHVPWWQQLLGVVRVALKIVDSTGGSPQSRTVDLNPVGNFWWDVALPQVSGSYTVSADAGLSITASLPFSISGAAVHVSAQLSLDPQAPTVNGTLKATVRMLANNLPVQGVTVYFLFYAPAGNPTLTVAITDAEGVATAAWDVGLVGRYSVLAKAAGIDWQDTQSVVSSVATDPQHPTQPTPEATVTPAPTTDLTALLGPIMALMLIGSLMGMMPQLTGGGKP